MFDHSFENLLSYADIQPSKQKANSNYLQLIKTSSTQIPMDRKLKSGLKYYKILMEKPPNSGH